MALPTLTIKDIKHLGIEDDTLLCSCRDDGEGAVFLAGEADGEFDVLAEGGEKFHQAANTEIAGAFAHEQGDLALLDAEDFGDFDLG